MIKRLRRHRAGETVEINTDGTWAISYGDMITLLLLFFVLFFSLDKAELQEKPSAIQDSLLSAFRPVVTGEPEGKEASKLSIGDMNGVDIDDPVLKKLGARNETIKVGSKVLVVFPEVSFFEFARTDVTPDGEAALKEFVNTYMPFAGHYQLGIRAYTDNKPVVNKRRYKDNLELSALRSVSAMRVLQRAGIPLNYMRLGGYGELNLTLREIEEHREKTRTADRGQPLARKVVLVIEPLKESSKKEQS